METTMKQSPSKLKALLKKIGKFFTKPENDILLFFGIVLTVLIVFPLFSILKDSFTIHAGTYETEYSHLPADTISTAIYVFTLTGSRAAKFFWQPFQHTLLLAFISCAISLTIGGGTAYLITRTNLKFKKIISAVFIFPYIMPQWTLALVWTNIFKSSAITHDSNGILAAVFGINAPLWVTQGLFPSAIVLGLHYAPFAYILIGSIFRNMDANLEEAATILNTPKHKIFTRVTLPLVKPAMLSTILFVFSSAMGSYPVPHYLQYQTLATKYMDNTSNYPGSGSIISIVMTVIGVSILLINQKSTSGRKRYTTVTGKSGQASTANLGKIGTPVLSTVLLIATLFVTIIPLFSFTLETFLLNPGDYSAFSTKWWLSNTNSVEGLYGQYGILHNSLIWGSVWGSVKLALVCSLLAGTSGMLIGYAVSKNRRSKFANYVNGMSFLPYLLPSLSVGAAFFIIGNKLGIYGTFGLLVLVGFVKYVPFAAKSSLNAMLQLSNEIEEAAMIQNISWPKRMLRIVMPIQKTAFISGYLLPFITCMRELTLFMMLAPLGMTVITYMDYFTEMGLPAFTSAINLILIVIILLCNGVVNKVTGASLDKGIGGA